MKDLVARLRNPPFGTETSERNLMLAAADEIARLRAAMFDVVDILGRAESNASGNPEWDYVGPRVAAFRAALRGVPA